MCGTRKISIKNRTVAKRRKCFIWIMSDSLENRCSSPLSVLEMFNKCQVDAFQWHEYLTKNIIFSSEDTAKFGHWKDDNVPISEPGFVRTRRQTKSDKNVRMDGRSQGRRAKNEADKRLLRMSRWAISFTDANTANSLLPIYGSINVGFSPQDRGKFVSDGHDNLHVNVLPSLNSIGTAPELNKWNWKWKWKYRWK